MAKCSILLTKGRNSLNKLKLIFKSRTIWGAILTGSFNIATAAPALQALVPYLKPGGQPWLAVNAALGAFTIYGRIQAKQPLGPLIEEILASQAPAQAQKTPGPAKP